MISIFTATIRRLATSITLSTVRRMAPMSQRIAKGGTLMVGGVAAVSDPQRINLPSSNALTEIMSLVHRAEAVTGYRMDMFLAPQNLQAARLRNHTNLSDLTTQGRQFAVRHSTEHMSALGYRSQHSSLFHAHDQGLQRLSDGAFVFRWVPLPPEIQPPLVERYFGLQRHARPFFGQMRAIRRNGS